jgi:hypothetical protein
MSFQTILKQISEETDRATLEAMAAKYPSIRKFAESGELLEGLRPKLRALGAAEGSDDDGEAYANDPSLPITELEKWRKFKKTDWPVHQAESARLRSALAEAQTRVSELEGERGTEMDADEVKEIIRATVKELGVASNSEVESRINEAVEKKINPTLNSTMNGLTNRFEEVFDKIDDVLTTHRQVFPDDKIRAKQVFDFMKANKIDDPEAAYKAMTADKYSTKQKTEQDAALAKAKEDGIKEGRAEAIKQSGRSMPVDGKGNSAPQGALMRRWQERSEKLKAEQSGNTKLGQGRLAQQGAQEFREKEAREGAA